VFSVADLFRDAFRRGAAWDRLQRDPYHMTPAATPIVAQGFSRVLHALDAVPPTPREWRCRIAPMRVLPAAPLVAAEHRLLRASGHRHALHAVLRQGDTLSLPVGIDQRLLGLVINCGAPGATVAFTGNGTRAVKHLVIRFDAQSSRDFISVFVHFRHGVPGGRAGIEVEVLPADAEETEPTLHARPGVREADGEIEVEGFLVVSREPVLSRGIGVARLHVSCDLAQVIETEDLVARLVGLRNDPI